MKILLTPLGSAGDNYPFIGVGAELSRRGHAVSILANDVFADVIRSAGLEFISIGTEAEYATAIADPNLWDARRGMETAFHFLREPLRRIVQRLPGLVDPGNTLVVAHTLDFASRALAEKTGLPVATLHLSPSLIRSEHDLPVMTGTTDFSFLPRWAKRLAWRAVDRWVIDPVLSPMLDELRQSAGLPPARRVFNEGIHSPLLTIGMFPDWFATPQPDWPPQLRLSSFPLWDAPGRNDVSEPLDRFLAAGDAPIVFTPGSAMVHGHDFFRAALDACTRLNRRGLLLTRHPAQLPPNLPASVGHFTYAPLGRILSRCAALVHHGGIGTTAAGFAAGVPQVLMPMSHDQPDNAARVRRLGAGDRLMPRKFHGDRLARMLGRLIESADVGRRCADAAARCRQLDGIARTCDLLEAALPRPARMPPAHLSPAR